MSEVQVPKPNRSACGFHALKSRGCKLHLIEDCIFGPGNDGCVLGKIARALYARQEADRKGASAA